MMPEEKKICIYIYGSIYIYMYICIYVYMYMYIYICCEVAIWAKFGHFRCYYLGQVGDIIWAKVMFGLFLCSGFSNNSLKRVQKLGFQISQF